MRLFLLFALFFECLATLTTVDTNFGILKGRIIRTPNGDSVSQFLGVPYGLAPTGQNRFGFAISAAKWTHQPKEANRLAPVCIQSGLEHLSETEALRSTSAQRFDTLHRIMPFLSPQSEDCLFMNIFVPKKDPNNHSQLSTVVVVHGSEYTWGSGNAFNGSIMAAMGNMIVVTLNYRLDIYGFLGYCETESCWGNAALSDLVAALKMLSNILPSFGGDSESVTLLGWGSGGSLISLLMASPITQPKGRLFRRAILLDGTALSSWAMSDHPQQYFLRIANELGCSGKNESRQMSQIVRCLQEQSRLNITTAARKIKAPTFMSAFGPIVDGQIVPNHPRFSFSPKLGALFREVDLMIGISSFPAHHFLSDSDLSDGIALERRDRILRTLIRNLYDFHRTEIFDAVLNEYADWSNPQNDSKTLRTQLLHLLSDALYVSPLIETARLHSTDDLLSSALPSSSSTYLFVFGHETNSLAESDLRGSDDIVPFVFGDPFSPEMPSGRFNDDDRAISRSLIHFVSNFVQSGSPSRPTKISPQSTVEDRMKSIQWPKFNGPTRESFLEITTRPKIKNFYRNAEVSFWNGFVPKLNRGNRDRLVDDEHHFLPDHFNRQTFFGVVRPVSSFHNIPFPPAPLPPTPFPNFSNDPKRTSTGEKNDIRETLTANPPTSKSQNITQTDEGRMAASSLLAFQSLALIAVMIGVSIVINICVCLAIWRKFHDRERHLKKQLKYHGYAAASDVNYLPSAPIQPHIQSLECRKNNQVDSFDSRYPTAQRYRHLNDFGSSDESVPGSQTTADGLELLHRQISVQEQEPLLATTSKCSTPALLRSGISPTCPRHGRAAQMVVNGSRANSVGSALATTPHNSLPPTNNISSTTLEEVQV